METTTASFDLNRAIQQWRDGLNQSPAMRRENLDELETHLRDSVATWQARGLTAEEAFFVAIKRAGGSAALGAEFGKVNTRSIWQDRVLWMLVGNLFFGTVSSLFSFVGSSLLFFGVREIGFTGGDATSGYLYIGLLSTLINLLTFASALAICWRLFTHNWGSTTQWLANNSRSSVRLAAVAAIGIVGLMLPRLVLAFSSTLLFTYATPTDAGRFATGQNLASLVTWLIQTAVFVILALWLARRRLLAKT